MTTTAQRLLTYLESRPDLQLKQESEGQYRLNSPLRPGSNSRGFTLKIEPDGEHGAFNDFAAHNGAGEAGSLYDLAKALDIKTGQNAAPPDTKRKYKDLADYAAAHYVPLEAFTAAGWQETTYINRPALKFTTKTGQRWRFTDGKEPPYLNKKGYKRCWYGLERAVKVSRETGQPLIICNGEASTITAQHYGLAAACVTSGEKSSLPKTLLTELQAVYTGKIIIAFDCDKKGRAAAPALAAHLQQAGFPASAVDLGGNNGFDLADFCGLHKEQATDQLQRLKEIPPTEQQTAKKSAEYIAALKSLGYTFRLNVLDDTVEVNQQPASDITAAKLRTAMRDLGYTTGMAAIEDAYITEAARNQYHPIKDYLESLTWDGKDHIKYLSSFFTDQQNIFGLWLKKWLVGSVAKIYSKYQNPMLVLDGGQDKGKSHFAAWLCPMQNHFMESGIQPDSNDHKIALVTTWVWEVVELGATTRRADREALKSFITLKDVTARKPYGRRPIHKPALASFIGTVNNESGFLNDPTGSRRFLTCTLTGINWDYAKKLAVSDVWAQAYHLYKTGFGYKLTSTEKARQAEVNEEYEVEEPLIAEVLLYYQLTGNPDDFVPGREILITLGFKHLDKRNTMRLSRAMKKHGIMKARQTTSQGREHGYIGLTRKPSQ